MGLTTQDNSTAAVKGPEQPLIPVNLSDPTETLGSNGVKRGITFGLDYTGTSNALQGCVTDSNLMQTFMSSQGYTVISHTSDDNSLSPTYDIEYYLQNFLNQTDNGDRVIIHYSGHGGLISSSDPNNNDAIFDENLQPITDTELVDILFRNIPNGCIVFGLFDCCNGGTIWNLPYVLSADDNGYNQSVSTGEIAIENSDAGSRVFGMILISASQDDQTAGEGQIATSLDQGFATWSFLESVKDLSGTSYTWIDLVVKMRDNLRAKGVTSQNPQITTNMPALFNERVQLWN